MNSRREWLGAFESMCEWVSSLRNTPAELWLEPIGEGKWSMGEIISHFYFWDRFIYTDRLLRLESNDFRKPDQERINKNASYYARSEISKEELISMFVQSRKEICLFIQGLPDSQYDKYIQIGEHSTTIKKYIEGMTEHDHHHKKQIENFLKENNLELTKTR